MNDVTVILQDIGRGESSAMEDLAARGRWRAVVAESGTLLRRGRGSHAAHSGGKSFSSRGSQIHHGWRLEVQANSLATGLGPNWVTMTNSSGMNQMTISIGPDSGSVFFRPVYP